MRAAIERRFKVSNIHLAARFWQGDGVPILALHGFLDNANSFAPLAELLPNPLLALDFAGHGLSEHRPLGAHPNFLDYVEDVCELVRQLEWDEMILLGHSMGAGVACLVAASRLLPLQQLWLLDGLGPMTQPCNKTADQLTKALRKRLAPGREKRIYGDLDAAAHARTAGFGGLSVEACRLLCERGLEACEGGFRWRADARLRLPSRVYLAEDQVKALLGNIATPTLLVSATNGLGGRGMMDHRRDYIDALRVVNLEGRHHLHMETPAELAQLLRRCCIDGIGTRSASLC